MEKNENRRSKLTRRIFRDSLKELLLEKNFGRISVREICERADMNRSTFYAHYVDQSDLLRDVEDEFLSCLKDAICQTGSREFMERYLDFLQFICTNGKLFLLLTAQNMNVRFRDRIIETVCTLLQSTGTANPDDLFFTQKISYAAAGSLLLIEKWVDGTTPAAVEDMAKLLLQLYSGIEHTM